MLHESDGPVSLFRFSQWADHPALTHAFATYPLNYAPHRGRARERAEYARRDLCRRLKLSFDRITAPAQVMGVEVLRVLPQDIGRGRDGRSSAVPFVDGLVCDIPGVPLMLLSADCPLIAVFDPDRPAIGAVHAGWQGTVAGAARNLVAQMQRRFASQPDRLSASLAPSAGPCCYQVGPEVRRIAETRCPDPDTSVPARGDGYVFDLWAANRMQLLGMGLKPDQIEVARLCTLCDERFWSHRRQKDHAGRSALIVALRES
jgi:hypothetical protein